MGLNASVARFATSRPHLLLVEAAGGSAARLRVERLARERGWPVVETPADADMLVVCGAVDAIEEYVSRVWDQLPGPRAQVRVSADDDAPVVLMEARACLTDPAMQLADVRRTERQPAAAPPMGDMDMGGHDMPASGPHAGHDMPAEDPHAGHDMPAEDPHAGHDMPASDPHAGHDMPAEDPHAGHDMGGMSGHEGHDMGGMEMPAGLGMADRAPDRDGLKLDVLTVPWGPVLRWWPEGLILTTVLQGDVVQSATVQRLGSDHERHAGWVAALAHLDPPVASAVCRLDALVRILGVAGWDGARMRCERLRDALLAGEPAGRDLPRLVRQVSRSRSLARMTAGIATTGGEDVPARYRRWLTEAVAALTDGIVPPTADEPHVLHQLPDLVTGMELAGLRLVVASLDLALSGAEARSAADA